MSLAGLLRNLLLSSSLLNNSLLSNQLLSNLPLFDGTHVERQVLIDHTLDDGLNKTQKTQRVSGNLDLHSILEVSLRLGHNSAIQKAFLQKYIISQAKRSTGSAGLCTTDGTLNRPDPHWTVTLIHAFS